MAIADDFTINYTAKTVTHTSGADIYTVLQYFQWLAGVFAASSQMDDYYAFVSDTPTVYRYTNDWNFGDSTADIQFLKGGSVESSDGDELWSNLYSIGSQEEGSQIYIIQDGSEIEGWWSTQNIDILLLVKTGGVDIDSGNVLAMCRETDYSFDHNSVYLGGGSRNPVGINNAPDLNYGRLEDTGDVKVGLTSVANIDAGSYLYGDTSKATARINYVNSTDGEVYLVMIEDGPFQNGEDVYERPTRGGANGTSTTTDTAQVDIIAGYSGDVAIDYVGPFSKDLNNGNGAVNYDTEVIVSGGRDVIDAYQYLKYITRHNSSDTVDTLDGEQYLEASPAGTYTAVKAAPFGTFAGGTFFGARGIWLYGTSSSSFILVDSANAQQSPPNYQKVSCSHASLSGCQIFVAEISAGEIVKDQYTISAADSTSITTTLDIDINKTPVSGSLRVGDTIYVYTSFSGAIFTITSDATGETGALFVPLLDVLADATQEDSDNLIFDSNITVRTTVRKYGFKEYTADTSFTSTGLTFSPILTTDPQAT
jgi:hypothetical protein